MEVQRRCFWSSIVRKNHSLLFCDDTAGPSSCSLSTAWLQRAGDSLSRIRQQTHRKTLASRATFRILACNQHRFAALCFQGCRNLHFHGDPPALWSQSTSDLRLPGDLSVLCFQRRGNFHFQGDPSVFCESNSRVLSYVPYSYWRRRRHRVFCGSTKQHSEGSSSSHQDQRGKSEDQKAGENGTLFSSPSPLLSPVALSPEACSEISSEEFSETKRLVETAMLAAAAGLAYFLSNTLRIENYFGCFFPLPLVISSLRWGVIAGRKTMAATVMLLLVLSGPLKAATYLLMHGFLGLMMGSLWRSKMSWGASVLICTLVRSLGAMGFVFLSSWLIRENILALITINAHASISFMLAAMGLNFVPTMGNIYFIFGILVLLNCGSFVFILHVLYAIFLKRLGLNSPLIFPAWLKAL